MAELEKFWVPASVNNLELPNKIAAFEGISKMGVVEPIIKPYKARVMYQSFRRYVQNLSDSGEFKSLLNVAIPSDSKLSPNKFNLRTHYGYGRGEGTHDDLFYYDGFMNLVLGYGKPKDRIAVTAGIENVGRLMRVDDLSVASIPTDDLIINQLQGPSYMPGNLIKETFRNLRWERLLSGVFVDWARRANLEKLYFLPAKYNKWDLVRRDKNQTAHLRYDVTAKRLGFRRDAENKPYSLDVAEDWKDLYTVFVDGK
jgi:hypothetical protein